MTAASFGKRGVQRRVPVASSQLEQPETVATVEREELYENSINGLPIVTPGVFFVIAALFTLECVHSGGIPTFKTVQEFGAVSRPLVLHDGQWWRLFTAPLLHMDFMHIVSNTIALLIAGILLEPLIGSSWFAAIFVAGALGGTLGSVTMYDNVISVGASGALMALLTAMLVCSVRFHGEKRGQRLRKTSLFFVIPALMPAAGSHTDLGAHIGGAVTGLAMGLLLQGAWKSTDALPIHRRFASRIGMAGFAVALLSFVLIWVFPTPKMENMSGSEKLIPFAEIPKDMATQIERSADLEKRFPQDPRSHLFRAISYLNVEEITQAQGELRTSLELSNELGAEPAELFRPRIRLLLALTMSAQQRVSDARDILVQGDCALAASSPEPDLNKLYNTLADEKICN